MRMCESVRDSERQWEEMGEDGKQTVLELQRHAS